MSKSNYCGVGTNNTGLFNAVPKQINHMVQAEGAIHTVIKNIYRHIFSGGTIDQIDHEDMIILILNKPVPQGVFRRKSAGTLYDRNIVYLNKTTGDLVLKTPAHWGNLDVAEVRERLDKMEKHKLV